jgi:hypothetical protein
MRRSAKLSVLAVEDLQSLAKNRQGHSGAEDFTRQPSPASSVAGVRRSGKLQGVLTRLTPNRRLGALAIEVAPSVSGVAPSGADSVCASNLPSFDATQPTYTTAPGEWDNPFPWPRDTFYNRWDGIRIWHYPMVDPATGQANPDRVTIYKGRLDGIAKRWWGPITVDRGAGDDASLHLVFRKPGFLGIWGDAFWFWGGFEAYGGQAMLIEWFGD